MNLRSNFPKDENSTQDGVNVATSDNDTADSGSNKLSTLSSIPTHPCDSMKIKKQIFNQKQKVEESVESEILEIDYCTVLNKVLPSNIRVIAWKEVTPQFSARFSAGSRTYRYFFVNRKFSDKFVKHDNMLAMPIVNADTLNSDTDTVDSSYDYYDLDVDRMNKAAQYLIGDHDFRNLCKMDVTSVSNFRRLIYSAEVKRFCGRGDEESSSGGSSVQGEECVYMLEITGRAFLWHMVRCIMSVLFLVGHRLEEPTVIQKLLDIDKTPARPSYNFAPELPLVLHHCSFDNLEFNNHSPKVLYSLVQHYNTIYENSMIAAMRSRNAMEQVLNLPVRLRDAQEYLNGFKHKEGLTKPSELFDSEIPAVLSSGENTSMISEIDGEPNTKRLRANPSLNQNVVFSKCLQYLKLNCNIIPHSNNIDAGGCNYTPLFQVSGGCSIFYNYIVYIWVMVENIMYCILPCDYQIFPLVM